MRNSIVLASFAVLTATVAATGNHTFEHGNSTWAHGSSSVQHGNTTYKHFNCGTHIGQASAHFKKTVANLHEKQKSGRIGTRAPREVLKAQKAPMINVPTYFHVITTAAGAGTITQIMANAQIAEMNTAYAPYGVSFTLEGTTFTASDAWAVGSGTDGTNLKAALRKGSYSTLNIYFQTELDGNILGVCTLPSQVPKGSPASTYVSDGCNVNANTMPGGVITGYNLGKTAVHETGHWLGLLHTFENFSCTGSGDFIADTPMESVSTNGCPSKPAKDSCPTVAGVDPIHNYMDYSTDACYEGFTTDQQTRIQDLWTEYRQGM